MQIAIMQPTYLPWQGYFSLINAVDEFVFLDDVQFDRRSWQVRNKILLDGKEKLISVSTQKAPRSTCISEIKLSDEVEWRNNHANLIENAYKKSAYKYDVFDIILPFILDKSICKLTSLNINIIEKICYRMGITTKLHYASVLKQSGSKSQHLLSIFNQVNGSTYISPPGSRDYIETENLFAKANVKVKYFQFDHVKYNHADNTEFVPFMSIVDLVANVGFDSCLEYLLRYELVR